MKHAIISDIHGNIHAFKAVLADAMLQNVDKFLLLGDYASSFPYGNDVVDTIRKSENRLYLSALQRCANLNKPIAGFFLL